MAQAATASEVDGRRQRREDNRKAVLDALVEMFAEGVYQPSSNEIAERAGLSPRSLFRYFDDVDDLSRAAIERQLAAARPLLDIGVGPEAPLETRIQRLAEARVRLFEAIAPAARAARVCAPRRPVIAEQMREARSYYRHQVARLFAAELDRTGGDLLPALDVLCSFESYDLLRRDQGLSRARTVTALIEALTALLDSPGGSP